MNTVTHAQYNEDLQKFIKKHSKTSDWKVHTSSMKDGKYHKEYIFENGAEFFEVHDTVVEDAWADIHGLRIQVPVKMFRHEYWSTDDSQSKYWYEVWG